MPRVSFARFKIIALALVVCALSVPAARAADKPLTPDDVTLLLIGGASSQKVVDLIKQRGIAFQMTAELATEFRRDGADDSVIQALENVGKGTPQTEASSGTKAGDQAQTPSGNSGGGGAASAGSAPVSDDSRPTLLRPGRSSTSGTSGSSSGTSSGGSAKAPSSASAQAPPVVPNSPQSTVSDSASGVAPNLSPPPTPAGPVLVHHSAGSPSDTSASASPATGRPPAEANVHHAPVVDLGDPDAGRVQQIIRAFADKETLFKQARDNYTFHQTNKVQELGPDGEVTGQFQQDWDILYDDNGARIERVTYAPLDSLKQLMLTEQDYDAFRQINPFVLTTAELPEYDVEYRGHVRVDQLTTYVFSIRPKAIQKGRQYFQGMVWVDDRDLQIVKSEGKQVPEIKSKGNENLFPHFTTWREQIDGKFWFPTFTLADDTLYFTNGPGPVHMKEIIKYTDYKQFKATTKTRVIGTVGNPGQQPPPNQKSPPKP